MPSDIQVALGLTKVNKQLKALKTFKCKIQINRSVYMYIYNCKCRTGLQPHEKHCHMKNTEQKTATSSHNTVLR
jgi:hypothetical protein